MKRIPLGELGKFRLNFSRCTNRDVAPLNYCRLSNPLIRFQIVFGSNTSSFNLFVQMLLQVNYSLDVKWAILLLKLLSFDQFSPAEVSLSSFLSDERTFPCAIFEHTTE